MNNEKTVWKVLGSIMLFVLILTFGTGFVNQRGGVTMDTVYVKDINRTLWKDIIVNGVSASGTSTPYDMGAHSYFGFGYKATWGTSSPHFRIEWFEGVGVDAENIFWEPLPAGTLTASNQASSDTAVSTFRPAVAKWVRFQYKALTSNATGTNFKAWLTRQ